MLLDCSACSTTQMFFSRKDMEETKLLIWIKCKLERNSSGPLDHQRRQGGNKEHFVVIYRKNK